MADTNPYGQQPQPQGMRSSTQPQQRVPMNSGMPNQGGYPPQGAPRPSAGRPGQPQPPQQKKNSKKPLIIVLVIILLLLAGLGIWWFAGGANSGFFDNSARSGQAPYKTPEEIQAELDRQVEEGMFNISIASVVEFADGTSPGTAYIENVPGNRYNMTVEITLDDNGEVVYQSRGLAPDSYIDDITLMRDLDPGTYPATATFTAYDTESLEEVGKAAAKVSLVIRG